MVCCIDLGIIVFYKGVIFCGYKLFEGLLIWFEIF